VKGRLQRPAASAASKDARSALDVGVDGRAHYEQPRADGDASSEVLVEVRIERVERLPGALSAGRRGEDECARGPRQNRCDVATMSTELKTRANGVHDFARRLTRPAGGHHTDTHALHPPHYSSQSGSGRSG